MNKKRCGIHLKKSAAAAVILMLLGSVLMIRAQAEDIAVDTWKYASFSVGDSAEEDLILGGLKLFGTDRLVYPCVPSEENENCSYRNDTVYADSCMLRTVKGERACVAAVQYYSPLRKEKKGVGTVGGNLYFSVPAEFTPQDQKVTLELEWFDEGNRPFLICYVNGESSVKSVEVTCGGTNRWVTKQFVLEDAYFNGETATGLGDGTCDIRLQRYQCSGGLYVRHAAVYTGEDAYSGRSYKSFAINGKDSPRAYFTRSMWTPDSKSVIVSDKNSWLYQHFIEDGTVKKLVHCGKTSENSDTYNNFFVSKNNYLYYDSGQKSIYRMNLDTYESELIAERFSGPEGTQIGSSYTIQVNNDDTRLSIVTTEQSNDPALEALNWGISESGESIRRQRRFSVFDITNRTWDLRWSHEFPDGTPTMTHVMINPVYSNLLYFCHEGTTTLVPDRMWTIDLDTGEKKNVFLQQPNACDGAETKIYTGETCGHENWTEDGEHLVFVKYSTDSNVGMNGIVRIDKYGRTREYINDDYDYWHCHPSSDNRFIVSDTQPYELAAGENVASMRFGRSKIVLIDSKTSRSKVLAEIMCGNVHPYHPHPAFSPDGRMVTFSCVKEDEGLCVGIMDITDLADGSNTESFLQNTNADALGVVTSAPFTEGDTDAVWAEGIRSGSTVTVMSAEYGDKGILQDVDMDIACLAAGEKTKLSVKAGTRLFLWDGNMTPIDMGAGPPECLRAVKADGNEVKLSWQAPGKLLSEEVQYNVYRDENLLGTVTDGYFCDRNIEADTLYHYRVQAVYPNGLLTPSAELTVETIPGEMLSELLGSVVRETGLKLARTAVVSSKFYTAPAEIDGRLCRQSSKTADAGFYYRVNRMQVPSEDRTLLAEIEYYDDAGGDICIAYSGVDDSGRECILYQTIAARTGSNTWKTACVQLLNTKFLRRSVGGYDFRIYSAAGDEFCLAKVYLENLKTYGAALQSAQWSGDDFLAQNGIGLCAGAEEVCETQRETVPCVTPKDGDSLSFCVDERFLYGDARHGVSVYVEYFDEGTEPVWITYCSNDTTRDENMTEKTVKLADKGNTGTWKRAKITMVDASFTHSVSSHGADLQILASDGLWLKSVKLTAMP